MTDIASGQPEKPKGPAPLKTKPAARVAGKKKSGQAPGKRSAHSVRAKTSAGAAGSRPAGRASEPATGKSGARDPATPKPTPKRAASGGAAARPKKKKASGGPGRKPAGVEEPAKMDGSQEATTTQLQAPDLEAGPAPRPAGTEHVSSEIGAGVHEPAASPAPPSAPQELQEPQTFRDLVSQSIESQPSLGWEKRLLAKWANRKKK